MERISLRCIKLLTVYPPCLRQHFLKLRSDTRTRGHSLKLIKKQSNKDLRLHFFSERMVNRWNKLTTSVLEAGHMKFSGTHRKCIARILQMHLQCVPLIVTIAMYIVYKSNLLELVKHVKHTVFYKLIGLLSAITINIRQKHYFFSYATH